MSSWGLAHVPDPLAKSENSSYHDIVRLKLRNVWDQNLPLAPDLFTEGQPSLLSTVTMWLHGCECLKNNHPKKVSLVDSEGFEDLSVQQSLLA